MKTAILVLLCTFIYTTIVCQQRKYIDLTGSETINPPLKSGWGLFGDPNFQDEFTTKSLYNYFSSSGCGDSSDKLIVIRSDHDWRWGWDFYGFHTEPSYELLDNVDISNTGYITLKVDYNSSGIDFGSSNFNDLRYPVKKYYSASEINTKFLNGCNQLPDGSYVPLKPENNFTYGWFEMRCRMPRGKYFVYLQN